MADAQDLKSWDCKKSCRFESDHRHQPQPTGRKQSEAGQIGDACGLLLDGQSLGECVEKINLAGFLRVAPNCTRVWVPENGRRNLA